VTYMKMVVRKKWYCSRVEIHVDFIPAHSL
jgi:hypothetical protein